MQEHKQIQLYVGLEEGGCVDVGAIKLDGFTLIATSELEALKADSKALANAVLNALYGTLLDEHGNRDENGLLAWGKAEDARNALIEVATLARKVGA